jgi:hypothetical protein
VEGKVMVLLDYLRKKFEKNEEAVFFKGKAAYYVARDVEDYVCIRKDEKTKELESVFSTESFDELIQWIVENFPKEKVRVFVSSKDVLTSEMIRQLDNRFHKGCWEVVEVPVTLTIEEMDAMVKEIDEEDGPDVVLIDPPVYFVSLISMNAKEEYQDYDGTVTGAGTYWDVFAYQGGEFVKVTPYYTEYYTD